MCDPRDLGVALTEDISGGLKTFEPNLYLYDSYPGGVGQSAPLHKMTRRLLAGAAEMLASCPCEAGCPSCVGPIGEVGERGKEAAARILAELLSTSRVISSGKDGVALGRRVERLQKSQPLAQMAAGQLARSRLHVDVAADPVQVEGQRVDEGLPGVLPEQLGFAAQVGLPAHQGFLEMPAFLVHLAVYAGTKLLAQQAVELVAVLCLGAVRGQFRHGAVEIVVVVGDRPVLDGEQQRSLLAAGHLAGRRQAVLGGLLEADRVSRAVCLVLPVQLLQVGHQRDAHGGQGRDQVRGAAPPRAPRRTP